MSFLLRQLIIPLFYKNMFLIILKTNFFNYIVSCILGDGVHCFTYVLIGVHIKKIKKFH